MNNYLVEDCMKEYSPKIGYFMGHIEKTLTYFIRKYVRYAVDNKKEIFIVCGTKNEVKRIKRDLLFLPFTIINNIYTWENLVTVRILTLKELTTVDRYCDILIYYQGNKAHKREMEIIAQFYAVRENKYLFFKIIPSLFFLYTGYNYANKGIQVNEKHMVVWNYE